MACSNPLSHQTLPTDKTTLKEPCHSITASAVKQIDCKSKKQEFGEKWAVDTFHHGPIHTYNFIYTQCV